MTLERLERFAMGAFVGLSAAAVLGIISGFWLILDPGSVLASAVLGWATGSLIIGVLFGLREMRRR